MTYELLEEANKLYEEIEHCDSLLRLFTTRSAFDDDYHQVILQRVDDSQGNTLRFGTKPMAISKELACIMYDIIYTEKERLEKEFGKLGENY